MQSMEIASNVAIAQTHESRENILIYKKIIQENALYSLVERNILLPPELRAPAEKILSINSQEKEKFFAKEILQELEAIFKITTDQLIEKFNAGQWDEIKTIFQQQSPWLVIKYGDLQQGDNRNYVRIITRLIAFATTRHQLINFFCEALEYLFQFFGTDLDKIPPFTKKACEECMLTWIKVEGLPNDNINFATIAPLLCQISSLWTHKDPLAIKQQLIEYIKIVGYQSPTHSGVLKLPMSTFKAHVPDWLKSLLSEYPSVRPLSSWSHDQIKELRALICRILPQLLNNTKIPETIKFIKLARKAFANDTTLWHFCHSVSRLSKESILTFFQTEEDMEQFHQCVVKWPSLAAIILPHYPYYGTQPSFRLLQSLLPISQHGDLKKKIEENPVIVFLKHEKLSSAQELAISRLSLDELTQLKNTHLGNTTDLLAQLILSIKKFIQCAILGSKEYKFISEFINFFISLEASKQEQFIRLLQSPNNASIIYAIIVQLGWKSLETSLQTPFENKIFLEFLLSQTSSIHLIIFTFKILFIGGTVDVNRLQQFRPVFEKLAPLNNFSLEVITKSSNKIAELSARLDKIKKLLSIKEVIKDLTILGNYFANHPESPFKDFFTTSMDPISRIGIFTKKELTDERNTREVMNQRNVLYTKPITFLSALLLANEILQKIILDRLAPFDPKTQCREMNKDTFEETLEEISSYILLLIRFQHPMPGIAMQFKADELKALYAIKMNPQDLSSPSLLEVFLYVEKPLPPDLNKPNSSLFAIITENKEKLFKLYLDQKQNEEIKASQNPVPTATTTEPHPQNSQTAPRSKQAFFNAPSYTDLLPKLEEISEICKKEKVVNPVVNALLQRKFNQLQNQLNQLSEKTDLLGKRKSEESSSKLEEEKYPKQGSKTQETNLSGKRKPEENLPEPKEKRQKQEINNVSMSLTK